MMSDLRECWSTDAETYNYDSLGELLSCNELVAGDIVHVAHAVIPDPANWVDSDDVIEQLACRANDECGEFADDYPYVTDEAKAELDALLAAWVTKHCTPSFYGVEGSREYVLTDEDVR